MCGAQQGSAVDGGELQTKPQLRILWQISLQRLPRGVESTAGLAEAEIKPESTACTALVGGVPPALQAGAGASCGRQSSQIFSLRKVEVMTYVMCVLVV